MTEGKDPKIDFFLPELKEEACHSRRPYAMKRQGLFWDFKSKEDQEELVCKELADSLWAQCKVDIGIPRKYRHPENPQKNFPDCLSDMNGKKIGIEVTELREGMTFWEPWPLERFQRSVEERIRDKNDNAQILGRKEFVESLHQLYVVIPTDEPRLPPDLIRKYLKQIRIPKPSHIDRAFLLVPREPADNAVIRGREHEPSKEQKLCIAFEVQWKDKD